MVVIEKGGDMILKSKRGYVKGIGSLLDISGYSGLSFYYTRKPQIPYFFTVGKYMREGMKYGK